MGKPRCNIPRVIFVAMPNIDVVIPVFNQAFELGKCLQGLRDQTLRDFSVIIVDDGSLPPLDPVNARDLSVRMVRQKNAGASAARNRGAREGSAPYILFCDADINSKKTPSKPSITHSIIPQPLHSPTLRSFSAANCSVFGRLTWLACDMNRTSTRPRSCGGPIFPVLTKLLAAFKIGTFFSRLRRAVRPGYGSMNRFSRYAPAER